MDFSFKFSLILLSIIIRYVPLTIRLTIKAITSLNLHMTSMHSLPLSNQIKFQYGKPEFKKIVKVKKKIKTKKIKIKYIIFFI